MQKGFAQTLLLLIVLVILGSIAGYWFFLPKSSETVIQNQITEPFRAPGQESTQPQTYQDEDLGLELKVPEGFVIKKESEAEYFKRANGDIRKNFTYYVQYPPAEFAGSLYLVKDGETDLSNATLSLVAFKNPDSLSPKAFYDRYWYYPFIWGEFSTVEKPKIAPDKVELITGREAGSAVIDFRENKPRFIYLPYGDKDLMLQIHIPSENSQSESILKTLVLN